MKKKISAILFLIISSAGLVFSQQKEWTLEECVKYAVENNIQIKQQVLQTMYQKNSLDLAKLKLLPTISGSASHNYTFGRALDETTYQYSDNQTVQSNNFYIGGSLSLFNGLQNYNTIQKNKYQVLAGESNLESTKDNVALNVALAYLQILLNTELANATNNQFQITKQQIEKTKKLVDAGSLARGNLLQIEAQAASEDLQYTNLKNQLDISYLTLTQLLELQSPENFVIVKPVIKIDTNSFVAGRIDDIYAQAQGLRPEIKSAEFSLNASQYDLKISKGGRSPRLTMNHSFSTLYSNIRQKILGLDPLTGSITYGKYSFADQINDNISYGLGFSLSIPILNGWQVNKSISNARISVENSQYSLDATKKQLYKNIQLAYTDAVAALKKFNSSLKAVSSAEESFRYTEQKFNVGMVTPVDYNASKTQLLKAQSDMAQAKYEYIFKTKVLDFYKGIPLNLNE
jgi:outer membrane protein